MWKFGFSNSRGQMPASCWEWPRLISTSLPTSVLECTVCQRHLIISIPNSVSISTRSMPAKLIRPCLITVGVVLLAPSCWSIMGAILVWSWWNSSFFDYHGSKGICIDGKYVVLKKVQILLPLLHLLLALHLCRLASTKDIYDHPSRCW
jgi:hypothetical protein